jgi:hypothetical protein
MCLGFTPDLSRVSVWRPLLYGVHFELVSDYASLRHMFQQKAPSARILRLCEFLADFDFQEVQLCVCLLLQYLIQKICQGLR